jgi:hypothetical protein
MDNGELIIENAPEGAGLFEHFVIPAQAGIQVTDTVRHTVEERYPGGACAWIPACAGMPE